MATDDSQPARKIGRIEFAPGILCFVGESEHLADIVFRPNSAFHLGGGDLFRCELPARGELDCNAVRADSKNNAASPARAAPCI
jgi:hypothetical protein